jgi:hypothetical protein
MEFRMTRRSFAVGALACLCAVLGACREGATAGSGEPFWAGVTPAEIARGNATRGPWRQNASDFDYVDDPTLAITGDGHIAVAWVDQDRQDVFFQMYAPDGTARFSTAGNLSSTPGTFSWMPRLVVPADDPQRVYALWQEIIFSGGSHGGEILFARSTDGGAKFSAPINLSNSRAGDGKGRLTAKRWDNGSLDLALGPGGQLYAAWTEYEGRLWVSRSADGGATFSRPIYIAGNKERAARAPALAVDSGATVHLVWSEGGQAAADIRIASSPDEGRSFGAPQVVASGGHADAPKIAADSDGRLHLVYGESAGGGFSQYRIRYTRQDARSGRFAEPRTIAAAGDGMGSVNFPDLAVGAGGQIYAVWELFPDPRQRAQGLGFTISRDGGQSFAAPEVVPGSDDPSLGANGGLQGSLMERLAANGDGTLALVNSSFAAGGSSHVWLWRRPAAAR